MSAERPPDGRDDSDDEALDRLLDAARWADPPPEALARLQARWRRLSPANRGSRAWPLVAAAALLVCLGLVVAIVRNPAARAPDGVVRDAPQDLPAEIDSAQNGHDADEAIVPVVADDVNDAARPPAAVDADRFAPRPPTAAERLALVRARRKAGQEHSSEPSARRRSATRRVPRGERRRQQLLERAIDQLRADPAIDVKSVADELLAEHDWFERQLADAAVSLEGGRQRAAGRLLAELATARSLPALRRLAAQGATREVVRPALYRVEQPAVLARLVESTADPAEAQWALSALAARDDPAAARQFLSFVARRETARLAMATIGEMSELSLEHLFAALDSTDTAERMAAARVLGQIDRAEVTQRLMNMVVGNHRRQEALVALLASERPEASDFLARAESDLYLVAAVRAAEYRFQDITDNDGR